MPKSKGNFGHPGHKLGARLSRYHPKGVFGKGVGNSKNASEMRQKSVKSASKWVLVVGTRGTFQNAPKMRQNYVKNASKMRGTPWGGTPFGRYRLRGRTATQRSKKGSEKVLERVLGKGSEKGVCYGF